MCLCKTLATISKSCKVSDAQHSFFCVSFSKKYKIVEDVKVDPSHVCIFQLSSSYWRVIRRVRVCLYLEYCVISRKYLLVRYSCPQSSWKHHSSLPEYWVVDVHSRMTETFHITFLKADQNAVVYKEKNIPTSSVWSCSILMNFLHVQTSEIYF